jgi:hypothetical protein
VGVGHLAATWRLVTNRDWRAFLLVEDVEEWPQPRPRTLW